LPKTWPEQAWSRIRRALLLSLYQSRRQSPVSVFIDGAYIRAVPGCQSWHFEMAMGRVVAQGQAPRQFAGGPNIATGKHDIVRAAMRAQACLPGPDVTVFSDGEIGLQSIVLSATRQPVTHILDWFHLSMRLRHIGQAWEGARHLQNLDVYLRNVAVHASRLGISSGADMSERQAKP